MIDVTGSISHVLDYFGVSASDAPTVRIIDMDTGKKFTITAVDLTADSMAQLCQDVLDGSAKVTHTHTHTHTHNTTQHNTTQHNTTQHNTHTHTHIFRHIAALNLLTCLILWCSPIIALRRSQRTGIRDQSKSWWGRISSLLLWTRPKTSLWSSVSQSARHQPSNCSDISSSFIIKTQSSGSFWISFLDFQPISQHNLIGFGPEWCVESMSSPRQCWQTHQIKQWTAWCYLIANNKTGLEWALCNNLYNSTYQSLFYWPNVSRFYCDDLPRHSRLPKQARGWFKLFEAAGLWISLISQVGFSVTV